MTLDNVIGQAFEEWGTPGSSKSAERAPRPLRPRNAGADQSSGGRPAGKQPGAAGDSGCRGTAAGGASGAARGAAALKQTHMTSFMNRMTDASGALARGPWLLLLSPGGCG